MGNYPWIVFSAVAAICNIAPLCWQVEHGNSGPISLGIWVIIANLNLLINGIIWRKDAINRAPVFCDISVKIQMAAPLGILASDICILLLLARVVSPRAKLVSQRDRRRRALCDYLFCFGFPLLVLATHIIYQPFRFGIARSTGCLVTLVQTWPTWICYLIWAPLLSVAGCLLAFYVGYRLLAHRRDFKRLVNNSDSALTASRFIRLGLLSSAFFAFNLPLSIYSLIRLLPGVGPYIKYDWHYIHSDFNYVKYNALKSEPAFGDWSNIIAGLLVMVFFGFGGEALSYYKKPLRLLGLRTSRSGAEDTTKDSAHHVTQISLKRYENEDDFVSPQELYGTGNALDYKYQGPFNRVDPCLQEVEDGKGIKVQLTQEAKVV